MNRFLIKWALAAAFGVALTAGQAPAQFYGRGGVPFMGSPFMGSPFMGSPFMGSPYLGSPFGGSAYMGGYNPYTIGNYSYFNPYTGGLSSIQYPAYQSTYGYSSINPVTGRMTGYQLNYALPYSPGGYGGGGYGGGGYGGGYGGTATGSYYYSSNPVTNEQLKILRNSAYQGSYSSGGSYGEPTKEVYSPRWTTGPATTKSPAGGKPADVNEALLKAAGDDIQSGRALNALAIEIRKLETGGAKAEAPLFPAEVLAKAAFDGPGSGLLSAAKAGKPAFPTAMKGDGFANLRADIERHFAAVTEPVAQGKAADPAAADRLAAAATKAKAAPAVLDLPGDDRAAATKFLDGLEAIAKEAKDPSLTGVAAPKWGSMGATASELVRYLDRRKLQFAPAPSGSEEAYSALYRGLSGYYAALAQAKK
jgi:hypothetical protein